MRMTSGARLLAVCLLALVVLGVPRLGAATETEGPRFKAFTSGYEQADVDEGGAYSKSQFGVSAGYQWFTLGYTRTNYSWSHTKDVNFSRGSEPWNELHKLSLDAAFDGYLTDGLTWFAGGSVIAGFEKDMWGSFTFAPRGGLRFSPTADLGFSVGAVGLISPVRPLVLPLIGIEWRNERDLGLSASLGFPATKVQYRFNDVLAARAAVAWSRDMYRLSNGSSVARKGYVEEAGYTSGAYLDITPLDQLTFTVGGELLSGRTLRIYEKGGDELSRADVERSLGAVLRASYAF